MKLHEIELGKKYIVAVPEIVQREVNALIERKVRHSIPQLASNWRLLDIDIMSETSIAKQIKNKVYKIHGIKVDDEIASDIASLFGGFVPRTGEYILDIVDHFDWKDGDFGDKGSCFWGKHSKAKDVLLNNGARVVRFYRSFGVGISRAILLPDNRLKDGFFVFNAYGVFPLWVIAFVLSDLMQLDVKPIMLHNEGMTIGLIYINDKGQGYALSDTETLQSSLTISYNLQLGDYRRCIFCEQWGIVDDMVRVADWSNSLICKECVAVRRKEGKNE